MFTEISWNSYLTIVIVLLAVYYVFIGLLYYSSNIVGLLSGKKFTQRDTLTSVFEMDTLTEKKNLFQTAHSLSDEIQAYLNEAGRNSLNKEDVVQSLKVMLAKYPVIKTSLRNFCSSALRIPPQMVSSPARHAIPRYCPKIPGMGPTLSKKATNIPTSNPAIGIRII